MKTKFNSLLLMFSICVISVNAIAAVVARSAAVASMDLRVAVSAVSTDGDNVDGRVKAFALSDESRLDTVHIKGSIILIR